MAGNPSPSGAAAAEKLALTLAASLLLHFALIFGLQIRAIPAAKPSARILQARLVETPRPITAPQVAPTQPAEPEPASDTPLPQAADPAPAPAAAEPPAPALPASAAAPENSANLPSIEVPLLEDPTYYPAQEVDVHPTALQTILPSYPEKAADANVTGSVVLVLLLDESGKVQNISVEEANPPGMFEQSAMDAFRHARFAPAQRHGRTVKSRMRIKVNYELTDKRPPVDKTKQK